MGSLLSVVQFLAVQKFTNELLPRLMKNAQGSSGEPANPMIQTAYLVGLSSLIRAIPKATYVHEMPAVSEPSDCHRVGRVYISSSV